MAKQTTPLEKRDNSIGIEDQRLKFREAALKALAIGKILEKKKQKQGYMWMLKGKTAIHIHPDKLVLYLQDNWRKIS